MKLALKATILLSACAISCTGESEPEITDGDTEAEKLKDETRLANIEYREVSKARDEYIARLTAERDSATERLDDLRAELFHWEPVAEGSFYEMVEEIEEAINVLRSENQRLREQLGLPDKQAHNNSTIPIRSRDESDDPFSVVD